MNENSKNMILNNHFKKNGETVIMNSSWLKDKNHPVLKKLEEKGGIIYMNLKGEISYRLSSNDPYITTKDYNSLSNIFSNLLEMNVDFSSFNKKIKNIGDVK